MKPILLLLILTTAQTLFAQQRPNIILILADDLGYGDVGYEGQQKIHTPNIDRLATLGMRFTQFYAGTSVCAPSRASLMTGRHTGHTAIRGNRGYQPEGQYPLPDSSLTIATVLQKNGYATGAFGKWGLGYPGSTGIPGKKGFTDFFGYNCQTLAHNYYPDHLWANDSLVHLPNSKNKDSVYSADLIHRHALEFIRRNRSRPFFLYLAYTLPHAELQVPHDSVYANYLAEFRDAHHAAYAAMVTRLDRYVGEILRGVQAGGLGANTLILFTSDNGPHREGGGDPAFFHSSGPLRGIKRDLYEGGIREPFIAVWPGKITPGATSNWTGAFWDFFPTFEQVAGIPTTKAIDGFSILPVLLGRPQTAKAHDYLYWEFHENNGRQAVRWGKWKGVRLDVNIVADPPIELYDLETDPGEQKNVAAQHPDIVRQIKTDMQESHRSNKDWPLLATENPKP
ncbi:arylsulfatase [Puia sp.]|uniref:arylsulfatase n=1 Tax=Puia sp. TaxID=2045100 RepID=UPI002F425F2A